LLEDSIHCRQSKILLIKIFMPSKIKKTAAATSLLLASQVEAQALPLQFNMTVQNYMPVVNMTFQSDPVDFMNINMAASNNTMYVT
jgi:hypothetical protein